MPPTVVRGSFTTRLAELHQQRAALTNAAGRMMRAGRPPSPRPLDESPPGYEDCGDSVPDLRPGSPISSGGPRVLRLENAGYWTHGAGFAVAGGVVDANIGDPVESSAPATVSAADVAQLSEQILRLANAIEGLNTGLSTLGEKTGNQGQSKSGAKVTTSGQ